MSDVLLIQPLIDENLVYNKSDKKDSESYKEKVRQIRIPQGLLSIGSYLNSLNYDVEIFDCRLHYENGKLTLLEDLRKKIKDSKILIGISVMTPYVAQTVEIINLIKKENPNIPIVLGGIHPTLFPEQTCEDKDVDFVIIGD